jgi:hypothetical protein
LNIPLTPREEFDERYNYYKENWRRLIAWALGLKSTDQKLLMI